MLVLNGPGEDMNFRTMLTREAQGLTRVPQADEGKVVDASGFTIVRGGAYYVDLCLEVKNADTRFVVEFKTDTGKHMRMILNGTAEFIVL